MNKIILSFIILFFVSCSSKKNPAIHDASPVSDKGSNSSLFNPEVARDSKALHHYILGQLSFNQDKKEQAKKDFNESAKYFDNTPIEVQLKLIEIKIQDGKFEEAKVDLEKLLTQNKEGKVTTSYIDTLNLYGATLLSLNNWDQAIETFEAILKLDTKRPEIYLTLSGLYSQKQNFDKALEVLNKFVLEYPDLSVAYQYISRTHEVKNQLKLAQEAIDKALSRDPDNVSAQFDKIRLLIKERKINEAKALIFKLLEKNPQNLDARRLLSHLLLGENKLDDALQQLKQIEPSEEDSTDTNYKIALILLEKKDYKGAEEELNKVIEKQPNHSYARFYIATIQSSEGRKDVALENLEAIEKDQEVYIKARTFIAQIEYERGNKDKAFDVLERLVVDRPEDVTLVQLCAGLLREDGQYQRSIDFLNKRIKYYPTNEKLYIELAQSYEKIGDSKSALLNMEEALKLNDKTPDVLNYVAYHYADNFKNGNVTELSLAEKYALSAVKQKPTNAYFIDTLAWVYFKQGKLSEAEKKQNLAISIVKNDSTLLEHYGDIKLALNDQISALKAYREALANIDPNTKEVDLKLQRESLTRKIIGLENKSK